MQLDDGLDVGQEAVATKANELTALRDLLAGLKLQGRIVTVDALGCQRDVVRTIADHHGHYLPGHQGPPVRPIRPT